MGSLQDALVRSGLAEENQSRRRKAGNAPGGGKPTEHAGRPGSATGRRQKPPKSRAGSTARQPGRSKSDLERAWLARKRAERDEKEREKQARVADQEARRKRNLELDRIVEGRILNDENAEVPRYFEHLGRIRRVLCTPSQRTAINAGHLGIVNLRGRYLIVAPEVVRDYARLAPDLVPDLTGSEPEAADDDYPPVPDDLTW